MMTTGGEHVKPLQAETVRTANTGTYKPESHYRGNVNSIQINNINNMNAGVSI